MHYKLDKNHYISLFKKKEECGTNALQQEGFSTLRIVTVCDASHTGIHYVAEISSHLEEVHQCYL